MWEREGGIGAGSGLAPHGPRAPGSAPMARGVPSRPSLSLTVPPASPRSYQAAQRLALRPHGESGRAPQRPRAEVRAAAQVEVPREAARGRRERARIRHRSRAVCPPCPALPPRAAEPAAEREGEAPGRCSAAPGAGRAEERR